MPARTLGNPRVKESKGARQARLLRALEHRVRRLEKQAWPAVTNEAKPILQFDVGQLELGPAVLGPLHRAAQDEAPRDTTSRTRLPFTLVEPEETFERHERVMRGVFDFDRARRLQQQSGTFVIHEAKPLPVTNFFFSDMDEERAHRWPDAVLRATSNRPEVPAPQPWWMRLHRFFVDLSRRALGVSAPSCGERGAGPSFSDDTQ